MATWPIYSLANKDKLTTAWFLSLPAGCPTSAPQCSERAWPCHNRLSQKIGSYRVDLWVVQCKPLPSNQWTIHHDITKMELMKMLGWSRVVATYEVTSLFQHLIPPLARGSHEVKKQSHGPDLALGETSDQLAELEQICREQYKT